MDRDRLADYQKMVADLRNAGIAAEMYLGSSGMKAQLKYADRRNSPAAIIAGSQRVRRGGKVQIKDLAAGKAQAAATADHQAWRDERPGQFEVARDELSRRSKSCSTGSGRVSAMPTPLSSRKPRAQCRDP